MGPPANIPPARGSSIAQSKPPKGKGSSEPPTLEQVRAKTVSGLITEVQFQPIRNHYNFPEWMKTRISDEGENIDTPVTKTEAPKEGMPPSTLRQTAIFWEVLNYGLQLPVAGFVDEVLVTLDRAPGQLMPFAWFVLTSEVAKLRAGFPEALSQEVFCDRDVLIKAGLTKGVENFPKFTLMALRSRKNAFENCIMPHKVAYKSITLGKDVLARISKRKGSSVPEASTAPKKSKNTPKVPVPETTSPASEALVEAFGPPSSRAHDPITIVIPDRVSPSLGKSSTSSELPQSTLPVSESSLGFEGPCVPTPYIFPSGITVTEETVSKVKSSTASLLMKNCMLRRDIEGIMTCAFPEELHDTFEFATECAYGLPLKWKEAKHYLAKFAEKNSSLEERLNEALARADDAENKYQDLLAVRDGLIKSKTDLTDRYEADMAALKRSLKESQQTPHGLRTQLDSSKLLLADTEKWLEELSLRPSPEVIVEAFKKIDTYRDLLIDNTVSIMKDFNSEVYPEFLGTHSFCPEFVEKTFGKEYVVELTGSEEEDTKSTNPGDDDVFVEDAPAEDASIA
ncbi:hypothetical protein LIER_01262 [Lithospermum erythrorhizon]|uniref:Uncharacterized protein n=1 Tax=Lithospermum erythrorhizon TaxID=34254 RepID=A0AAV3NQ34_LITER